MYRQTYLEVDCSKYRSNLKKIMQFNKNYKYYFGVVKNNCYHHGLYLVRIMKELGINYFAVSSIEEALDVRKYDDSTPILCLEPVDLDYVYDAINNNITLTISSLDEAKKLSSLKFSDKLNIHFKIDSGMNRLGFKSKNEFKNAFEELSNHNNISIEGIYTHFATEGLNDKFYDIQVKNFLDITSLIDLGNIPIVHVDRSYTSLIHEKHKFANGFRIGLSMYGYLPAVSRKYSKRNIFSLELKPVLSLFSSVIALRNVSKGEFIGYGARYKAKYDSIIATIPCGYADGVSLDFKYVYIKNNRYKIVAECMDMVMIEVDDQVKIGDRVEFFGINQSASEVAKRIKIIDHKFLNLFSNRVPVVYIDGKSSFEVKY